MEKIEFVLITIKNIKLAVKVAKEIFPYEISSEGLFLPAEEYKLATGLLCNLCNFFIVKYKKKVIGITGYYYNFRTPKSSELWLGYFGLKQEFRGNGLGKRMLLKTLDLAKEFNEDLHLMKLYTSNREEEVGSHHLYRCVGFKIYAHRNTKPFHTYYFKLEF
jgi:RimJ/RimL family protein N-acetyltransferase